jgi:hypothetical protein
MDVLESAKGLIDEVRDVIRSKILTGMNDTVEIGLHQLGHQIDVGKASRVPRLDHLQQRQDVRVGKMRHHLDLAIDSSSIGRADKGIDNVLHGNLLRGRAPSVVCCIHRSVSTLADKLVNLVSSRDLGNGVVVERLLCQSDFRCLSGKSRLGLRGGSSGIRASIARCIR